VDALVSTGLAKSNKMAREFIGNNAVSVNGQVVNTVETVLSAAQALHGKYLIVKRGKKLFHLVKLPVT
jgi:tyrosyl-tRNA synthetase